MGFFNRQSWGGGGMRAPHHNFVVIVPMIMKFGTGIKPDVFYTMVTKKFVTSLILRHYTHNLYFSRRVGLNFRYS